jgi:hypothetical protein
MAANLRYLLEGISAGFLFGQGTSGHGEPTILAGIGAYLVADLVYQTVCELRNYSGGNGRRFGACEQPATLAIEAGYGIIERLATRSKTKG